MTFLDPLFHLSLAWLAYFILHSVLASLWLKSTVAKYCPYAMPYYRLLFNAIALLALLPILNFSKALSGDILWSWQGMALGVSYALSAVAIFGFIHSLKFYDMQEFMGIRQIKDNSISIEDQENLHLSPYHRYVRHPWYFFALVLIWVQNMDSAWLVSSIMLTLYFYFGSKLEDRKLISYYGDRYTLYITKVCGIFPCPWRTLSVSDAQKIQQRTFI